MGQFYTLQLPGPRGVNGDLSSKAHCFALTCATKTSHEYANLLKPLFALSSCFIYTAIYTLTTFVTLRNNISGYFTFTERLGQLR